MAVPASTLPQTGTTAPKPEQYLCATDHSAGMVYDKAQKSWRSTTFRPDTNYVISKSDRAGEAFRVTNVGQKFAGYYCKEGFNASDYLDCDGIGEFAFNKRNGRFLATYTIAYVHVGVAADSTDANSDTPIIAIGKCSPF